VRRHQDGFASRTTTATHAHRCHGRRRTVTRQRHKSSGAARRLCSVTASTPHAHSRDSAGSRPAPHIEHLVYTGSDASRNTQGASGGPAPSLWMHRCDGHWPYRDVRRVVAPCRHTRLAQRACLRANSTRAATLGLVAEMAAKVTVPPSWSKVKGPAESSATPRSCTRRHAART
jgi:hypothetical protein